MAYLDQSNDPRRRVTAIAGVAIIHAAIGLGVVTGLTVAGIAPKPDIWNPFPTTPEPKPTPTPTPETKSPEPTNTTPTVNPVPDVKWPPEPNPRPQPDEPTGTTGTETGPWIPPTVPPPLPTPTSIPHFAKPSSDRNGWITTEDYPAAPLRKGIEGVVGYSLIIGSNGRVSACDVVRSSGNSQLDEATCRLITRRARFDPATDGSGAKIIGSFSGTVLWQIPD
ncbi:energy transducer TonB [Altererythrobacter sp. Root672]|uniref:energy transducer TonB n=1 Tax=Altererythrobacter sp. Root672 TaxID=1736584 RepID=UPI0012E34DC2|nr:energy transducer TonB [Altererythrobacter sp. Root672]